MLKKIRKTVICEHCEGLGKVEKIFMEEEEDGKEEVIEDAKTNKE